MSTSKISPNKLEVAKKQIKKEVLEAINIPSEINENEKHLFHVLIIDSSPNQATLAFEHKAKVQAFNDRSWESVKNQLKQLGYNNVHILHDPTVEGEGENVEQNWHDSLKRNELINKAVELGYEGAKNLANDVYISFIEENTTVEERAEL